MPNDEEVKTEERTATAAPNENVKSKEKNGGGVKLVHKVYENNDENKTMQVYVCCNIL